MGTIASRERLVIRTRTRKIRWNAPLCRRVPRKGQVRSADLLRPGDPFHPCSM